MADHQGEQKDGQKKGKWPWGATVWGLVTTGLLVRALYHSRRAVIEDGEVVSCAGGSKCQPFIVIRARSGSSIVYAVTAGKVVLNGELAIASKREPVVVSYGGTSQLVESYVQNGEEVGIGTPLGLMKQLSFRVIEISKSGSAPMAKRLIEPAAWLAAHGLSISHVSAKGSLWCTRGRELEMPATVSTCSVKLPKPPGFLLLPVSVTTS